jgi:Uma2 family endonuclease
VPELVIEIISPGQTFAELTEKATNYLVAGVERVWVVDSKAQSVEKKMEELRVLQAIRLDNAAQTRRLLRLGPK